MLEQQEDILNVIKNSPKYKQLQKAKKVFVINRIKKISKYIIIIGISISILFFPVQCGSLIGNWINDFFGTIVNSIK